MNGKTFLAFLTGAAIGAAGTWYYLNKKYFAPVEEPEEDSEEPHESKQTETSKEEETDEAARIEYSKIASQYTEPEPEERGPYVISPDEFNDGTMITHCTLSYFEDGVLTDEYNEIVEDAEEALGTDFMNHFEEDLVYIRNEKRKCDYEILREGITYHEPHEEE